MMIVGRHDLPASAWDDFVLTHPDGWFWHTGAWLDYCLRYAPSAKDRSFAVVADHGSEVIGIWPLIQEGDVFAMGGNPLPDRLCVDDPVVGDNAVRLLARLARVQKGRFRKPPIDPAAADPMSWPTYVLNLDSEPRHLWHDIRKSYKSLIHKAERERIIIVTTDPAYVPICHDLHAAANGRETRSATWDLWERWAIQGWLVMALISQRREVGEEWTGFASAIVYKSWAYYAASATLEDNTAHALQWALIRALRQASIRHYELGWGERPGDTAKDQGISQFKAGWGGRPWMIPAVERRFWER